MKKRDIEGNRLLHFELSDKNRTVRWVLIVILLVVAAVSIVTGLMAALETPAGWQTVKVDSANLNCSEDFVLQYEYGAGEASPTAESKALQLLYGKAVEDAWKLFFNEAGDTDLVGIYDINQNPNREIRISEDLYQALLQLEGTRVLYLAPVYAEYDRVFFSENDTQAKESDPGLNEEQRDYVQKLADFANDPNAVRLVLRGYNKVEFRVSEEYLAFAKENEIRYLLDFGWLRNALIVDYFADLLTENGFTNGYIASLDGFTRNLDQRGNTYSLNLFNKGENGVGLAAVMEYSAPKSLVLLRNYPMYDTDAYRYYCYEDGRTVTSMIDLADGQSKTATDNLVSYSDQLSCGKLALTMMPVYVAESLSEEALNALTEQGIYSVWFSGKKLMYNQMDLSLTILDPNYTK